MTLQQCFTPPHRPSAPPPSTFPLSPGFCFSLRLARLPSLKPPSSRRQRNTKRVRRRGCGWAAASRALCLAASALESRLDLSAEDGEGEVTRAARVRTQKKGSRSVISFFFFLFLSFVISPSPPSRPVVRCRDGAGGVHSPAAKTLSRCSSRRRRRFFRL